MMELMRDLEELQKLLSLAEREKVKSILGTEIEKLKDEIGLKKAQISKDTSTEQSKPVPKKNINTFMKLTNYAWDQSEKFVKIYVDIKNVQDTAKEDVVVEFNEKSFELKVSNVNKKSYSLVIKNLMNKIDTKASYHKVKTDMVAIFLRKADSKSWSHITVQDKTATEKSAPKLDEGDDADPSAKMMNLLKQMYNDGDDDMKRTIAKSWSESRNKSPDIAM